jgi:hypothetical protein
MGMAKDTKEGIHIVGLEQRNFHKISVAKVEFIPGKGLVTITGLNASGKTSLLRGIRAPLGGGKEIRSNAVKEGEDAGYTKLWLSNEYTVARNLTKANPKGALVIKAPEGAERKPGKLNQGTLNGWLGVGSFDPLAIGDLSPSDMRDALLSIATDPELPTKLDALKTAHASIYEQRTPLISRKQVADRMECPDGERPEPVDVSAEMDAFNDHYEAQAQRQAMLNENEIEQASIQDYKARIKSLQYTIELRKVQLEKFPDVSEEVDASRARIDEADGINKQLEPWKAWDHAMAEKKVTHEAIQELTSKLKTLESEERKLLADSGIPVDGLSFSEDGEPLLNGLPLSVASGRERVMFFVQMAFAADPDLRVCLLDDEGNSLDLDGMEELDRLAKSKNFQVFICRIGLEGSGEIVVEDGVARNGSDNRPDVSIQDVVANE